MNWNIYTFCENICWTKQTDLQGYFEVYLSEKADIFVGPCKVYLSVDVKHICGSAQTDLFLDKNTSVNTSIT